MLANNESTEKSVDFFNEISLKIQQYMVKSFECKIKKEIKYGFNIRNKKQITKRIYRKLV